MAQAENLIKYRINSDEYSSFKPFFGNLSRTLLRELTSLPNSP